MTITIRLATPDDYAAFCDLNAQIDALHHEQELTVFRETIPSRGRRLVVAAALTKLYFLLSRGLGPSDVRHMVQMNLRGELTPPMSKL